jgi:DNA-binding CsgD family transcriptional regulator
MSELSRCRTAPDANAERIKALEWALGWDEDDKRARDQQRLDKSVDAAARKRQRAEGQLAREERGKEILRLKRSGATYQEIAARTGVAKSYVYWLKLQAERREQWQAEGDAT